MTNLVQFSFEANSIQTIVKNGEIFFRASDLAHALNFGNSRQAIATHVDAEDVQLLDTPTKGGNQKVKFVNESGMYALIFGSTKPEAKRFKKWVTAEVLPTIRKTGQYTTAQKTTKDERKPLVQAVNMLVTETGAIYSTVWKMIHQRFGVDCVDELTNEQVYQAVVYVHGLILQQGKNPVDDARLYKALVDSAIFLREYAHLIRQLNGVRLFDDKMGRHTCKVLVDHINDIFRLAHDMELTNKDGRPMFEKNRINYYVGGYMPVGI